MHRTRRLSTATILAIAMASIISAPAAADCQMAGPIEEEMARAEVVFVGTATDVIGSMARFDVQEVWKGPVGSAAEVHGLTSGVEFSEDDRHWEAGTTYLVVPYVEGQVLRDSICSATTEWAEGLGELRPADAVIGGSGGDTEPESAGLPTALLVAIGVFVTVAGVSVLAFRRRGEESG